MVDFVQPLSVKAVQNTTGQESAVSSADKSLIKKLVAEALLELLGKDVHFTSNVEIDGRLDVHDLVSAWSGLYVEGGAEVDSLRVDGDVELATTSIFLYGPDATEGTWRRRVLGTGELVDEVYTSGNWVEANKLSKT